MGSVDDLDEEKPATIKVMPDGPLVISGSFTLHYSGNKKEVNESIISLCRCGASNHMPFCDGAHRKVEFNDN
jgi:CDGSH-type Zn-finger protein